MGLFLVALVLRLLPVLLWSFDGLYGQDAFAYYKQAVALAERLPHGLPPPTDFFWPNGYPFVVALTMALFGPSAWVALLVNVMFGSLLAPLTYALARDLFPEVSHHAGLLAGGIVALAGQPLLSSIVIMADMAALFWAALAAWMVVRAFRAEHPLWWLLGLGAVLGLAVITRWIYGVLIPVFAAYLLYQIRRQRYPWWWLFVPLLPGALVVLPQVWLSLGTRPEGLVHSWLVGWHPLNAFRTHFEHVDGQYDYALPVGLFYTYPAGHPVYLFPPLGLAALWGLGCLWRMRQGPTLLLLAGWGGTAYLFLAGIPLENMRFGLTLYLPVVLLAGLGVVDLQGRLRRRWLVPTLVAASLMAMTGTSALYLNRFIPPQQEQKVLAQQVEARLMPGATLLAFGLTLTVEHYTDLKVHDVYLTDAAFLDSLAQAAEPLYVLLDVDQVETRWRDRPPALTYRWLQDHTTLRRLERLPPYDLFQVHPREE